MTHSLSFYFATPISGDEVLDVFHVITKYQKRMCALYRENIRNVVDDVMNSHGANGVKAFCLLWSLTYYHVICISINL